MCPSVTGNPPPPPRRCQISRSLPNLVLGAESHATAAAAALTRTSPVVLTGQYWEPAASLLSQLGKAGSGRLNGLHRTPPVSGRAGARTGATRPLKP